jgi:predicted MPP superfamily phosphohydrolase
MFVALLIAAALLALLGHAALCITFTNRLHAIGLPRPVINGTTHLAHLFLLLAPPALGWWACMHSSELTQLPAWLSLPWMALIYVAAALLTGLGPLPLWIWRRLTVQDPPVLLSNHTQTVDLRSQLDLASAAAGIGRFYVRIPGNQSLTLSVHEKTLELPRLPPALDGLAIVHLSDLHYTGRIGKAYFEEVMRRANDLQGDLVAITGDLVDKSCCIGWLTDTLCRLHAPHGVYFVLGNHDRRVDAARLRQILTSAGLIDLAGGPRTLHIRGQTILLAGNELPWFPASGTEFARIPPSAAGARSSAQAASQEGGILANSATGQALRRPLKILLSHSPDQIQWARQRDFDLMLAGHTHGGQIRLPILGPLVAPSRYGVKYASGTFHEPPTVMHVSRGLSGLQPIRWNCPPELTRLILRAS